MTERLDGDALAAFVAWCRDRETLPLLGSGDLLQWSRQSPAEFAAAVHDYRALYGVTATLSSFVDPARHVGSMDAAVAGVGVSADASDGGVVVTRDGNPTSAGRLPWRREVHLRMFPWD